MIAAADQNTWDARVRTILDALQMTDDVPHCHGLMG
jgi:hypothetical protein